MTNSEAKAAVLAWIGAEIPALAPHSYDHVPPAKPKGLPDVVCELLAEGVLLEDPDFPLAQLQQVALRRFDLGLSFMVDATAADPDDPSSVDAAHGAAQAQLEGFAETLTVALLNDPTLGQRVPLASPRVTVDYTPPFVEYEDGTRGREMTVTLAVAEPVVAAD